MWKKLTQFLYKKTFQFVWLLFKVFELSNSFVMSRKTIESTEELSYFNMEDLQYFKSQKVDNLNIL